jgi:hypothetical protein
MALPISKKSTRSIDINSCNLFMPEIAVIISCIQASYFNWLYAFQTV